LTRVEAEARASAIVARKFGAPLLVADEPMIGEIAAEILRAFEEGRAARRTQPAKGDEAEGRGR
jgi:hypothetical protein